MTKQRKKPGNPFDKMKEDRERKAKGRTARRDLGIPEVKGEEEAEDQAKADELTIEAMKAQGLIVPPQPRPWEVISPKAGKKNDFGRPVLFETAEELKRAAMEYFQHEYDNPEYKAEFKDGLIRSTPTRPLLTITGLCIYLGVGERFWREKRQEKKDDPDFSPVFEWADQVMYNNKFQGAAKGFFKENIIARELGLKDHTIAEVEDKRKAVSDAFPDIVSEGMGDQV